MCSKLSITDPSNSKNSKKNNRMKTPGKHIRMHLLKNKDKILKAAKEEKQIYYTQKNGDKNEYELLV